MLRSTHGARETETLLLTRKQRDPWGRTLEEAQRDDLVEREARWKRSAKRVSRLFGAYWVACSVIWIASAIGIALSAFPMAGKPPDWQIYTLFGAFFLAQWVLPTFGSWQLPPIKRRQIERVVHAARAEGVELDPADYL